MPAHSGVPVAAQLRERLDAVAHELSSVDISSQAIAAAAAELALIGEAFVRMLDDFDWSPPGWHAVTADKFVRRFALTTRKLARVELDHEFQSVDGVVIVTIVRALIQISARLVGPLHPLGTRTSNWVYTYTGIGEILRAFKWVVDLGEMALADACATSRGFDDPEKKILFDEMMSRGFARTTIEFGGT
ncbi:MAG TPA: hypothetical protein VE871_10510 [Longimicrobium sp.]|nr:hypothetical protein [Longimicrobium sp.]